MRCPPRNIWNTILNAVVLLVSLALMSCGTTCFSGIIPNNNGIILTNSVPLPACPTTTGSGTMSVSANKSQMCEMCTASVQAQHIFVTLKSIQLHSLFPDSSNNNQWVEVAPELDRKLDLVLDSAPEILAQSAPVPAGSYSELLLRFLPDGVAEPDILPIENSCGHNHRNCVVMADGRVEYFHFPDSGDSPELLLPLQYNGSDALAVVPGATVDLQLTLQPQQIAVAALEGWQVHYVLVGSVSVSR